MFTMIRMVKRLLFLTCSIHIINFINAMCIENDEITRFVASVVGVFEFVVLAGVPAGFRFPEFELV